MRQAGEGRDSVMVSPNIHAAQQRAQESNARQSALTLILVPPLTDFSQPDDIGSGDFRALPAGGDVEVSSTANVGKAHRGRRRNRGGIALVSGQNLGAKRSLLEIWLLHSSLLVRMFCC